MGFELASNNTLFTGGTTGIDLAVAKRFVKNGANEVISGRWEAGDAIAKQICA